MKPFTLMQKKLTQGAQIQRRCLWLMMVCLGTWACQSPSHLPPSSTQVQSSELQIAFMPDIHFHDIYADFDDDSFAGLVSARGGKSATIRTMSSQLKSTRLFNENYFALLAALDDIVSRGVKLVALPGDFSDDGQVVHMRGLGKILDRYAEQYGIEFFSAPGNHDPERPYARPAGKADYLGAGGREQRIFSKGMAECQDYKQNWTVIDAGYPLTTICSEEVKVLGYLGVMAQLEQHGFYPKPNYLYWESPYSQYEYLDYDVNQAQSQASLVQRQYEICHQGTGGQYRQAHYDNCLQVPDASYVVEPVDGLWLLAIDANVYVPRDEINAGDLADPFNFSASGNAGYNKMVSHKAHVMVWIESVVKRAAAMDKQLIAFSHFPMVEFYDQQSNAIETLFGANNFQLVRRPDEAVSQSLAATGLKVHVGGHMHINDTGIKHNKEGQFLFNIQAPSIAAYVPAYKLMTLKTDGDIEVETIVLTHIPRFNELFDHYREEYQYLVKQGANTQWDPGILDATSYAEFTQWHIRELTRQRFLPQEWPIEIRTLLFALTGRDILVLSRLNRPITLAQLTRGEFSLSQLQDTHDWEMAVQAAAQDAVGANLDLADFSQWNGFDLAVDFYRLRNADQLALRDINQGRLRQYTLLTRILAEQQHANALTDSVFVKQFGGLFEILDGFRHGLPNDHFMLDMTEGTITDLKH